MSLLAAEPWQATEALESWTRTLAAAERPAKAMLFTRAATEVLRLASPSATPEEWQGLVDELYAMGQHQGLADDVVQTLMAAATQAPPDRCPQDVRPDQPIDDVSDTY